MRKLTSLSAIGVLALALAACGNDSDDTTTDSTETETTDTEDSAADEGADDNTADETVDEGADDDGSDDAGDAATASGDLERLKLTEADLPEGYTLYDTGAEFNIDDLDELSGSGELEDLMGETTIEPAHCADNNSMNGLDLDDVDITDMTMSTAVNEATGTALSIVALNTEMNLDGLSDYIEDCSTMTMTFGEGTSPTEIQYAEVDSPAISGASAIKSITMTMQMDIGGQSVDNATTYHYVATDGITIVVTGNAPDADTELILQNTLDKI